MEEKSNYRSQSYYELIWHHVECSEKILGDGWSMKVGSIRNWDCMHYWTPSQRKRGNFVKGALNITLLKGRSMCLLCRFHRLLHTWIGNTSLLSLNLPILLRISAGVFINFILLYLFITGIFLSWPNTQFIRHNCKPMPSKEM